MANTTTHQAKKTSSKSSTIHSAPKKKMGATKGDLDRDESVNNSRDVERDDNMNMATGSTGRKNKKQ